MLPNEVYVPNPQFNVAPFGKVINLTFNQTFLRELSNVLNFNQEISEDFQGFVDDLAALRASNEEVDAIRDEGGEYGLFKYGGTFIAMLESNFALDLSAAVNDSVRLFSEGKSVHVGSMFAFSKRLQSAAETEQRIPDSRNYGGRTNRAPVRFPQRHPFGGRINHAR